MTYRDWESGVPEEITADPLWTVEAYRLGLFASDLCWVDIRKVRAEKLWKLADQLLGSVGRVSADIAEGYPRPGGKDRAHFYEDGLGSAREGRDWYFKARHVLGEEVATHRIHLLTRVIRLLMTMAPEQRASAVREPDAPYGFLDWETFLATPAPFPADEAPPTESESRVTHHASRVYPPHTEEGLA